MFTLPDLPYAYDALEPYIDKETMMIHHDKHHAAYVTNLNKFLQGQDKFSDMTLEELMHSLPQVPEDIRVKVRNNGGGVINHTFFWKSMIPGQAKVPAGELAQAIDSTFGGFAKFQESFTKAAMDRFGSGWAWLILDNGKLSITSTQNQDNPWMENNLPILAVDVWEHAYYLKYQNRRAEYLTAWWNVVHWEEVSRRFSENSARIEQ